MSISTEGSVDWAGGQGREGGGEWRAELVGIVMVWETTRKGKGPGKWPGRTTEMEKRDVSGFVQEENLGCPYHEDIFVRTQDYQDATPLPRESWPTFVKFKASTGRRAGQGTWL